MGIDSRWARGLVAVCLLGGAVGCGEDEAEAGRPASVYGGPDSEEAPADGGDHAKRGSVELSLSRPEAPVDLAFGSGSASFFDSPVTSSPGTTCTEADDGACHVVDCVTDPKVDQPAPNTVQLDAGRIYFEGPRSSFSIDYRDEKTGYKYLMVENAHFAKPGETVRVVGLGGTVPAFATTLTVRPALKVTQPSVPELSLTRLMVSTKASFKVKWANGEAGVPIEVSVVGSEHQDKHPKPRRVAISCLFDGGDGGGTVPASLMARLPIGPNSFDYIAFDNDARRTILAGDYRVDVRATVGLGVSYVTQYQ